MSLYILQSPWYCGFTLIICWIFSIGLYRVYFHPLARYPGPLLAKITDLYNVYHCFVGDRHLEFHRIHQTYGDVVRYGPNRVSINTATALHSIYSSKANVQKSSHFQVFTKFFPTWSTQTIIDCQKHSHKPKRKVLTQALTDRSLQRMERDITPIIQKFCSLLQDGERSAAGNNQADWSSPKDMAKLTGYLSFDIMGQICFGQDFEMLDKEDNRYILDIVSDGAQCLNTIGHMQSLLHLGIHKILFPELLHGLRRYKEYSASQCHSRLEIGRQSDTGDVFSRLLEARSTDTGDPLFTSEELLSESSLLIIAGSDTTSTCIAATLFYLLHNHEILENAQAEIRQSFGSLDDIRGGAQLTACSYLRACVDESLRMSPPVGGLMPREVSAGGLEVDGLFFPQGTEVGTPHYALHHNSAYYPDPFQYNPSRWLVNAGNHGRPDEHVTGISQARDAFCPWSVGPRSCVGKAMAYLEITTVLGRLLWGFDMRLSLDSALGAGNELLDEGRRRVDEYQLWDTFASKSYGPLIDFRPRKSWN